MFRRDSSMKFKNSSGLWKNLIRALQQMSQKVFTADGSWPSVENIKVKVKFLEIKSNSQIVTVQKIYIKM